MSLVNQMLLAAQRAGANRASTRLGEVTSFDPNTYSAVVRLKPENTLTGWLPITSAWVGNNWGLHCPPSIGDLVEVQFQEDDHNAGFIVGRFYNDNNRPLPVDSGEFWLVHKSGSFMKFKNDGTVEIHANTAITSSAPVWNHTGPVNITGKTTVTGDIVASGDISDHNTKSMAGMRSTYNSHTHTDPQGGSVGTPSTGM